MSYPEPTPSPFSNLFYGLYVWLGRFFKDRRITELLHYNNAKVEEVRVLRMMLKRCMYQFREYERLHMVKNAPGSFLKAETNKRFADTIWNVLDARI
jgi:hypothetical protein